MAVTPQSAARARLAEVAAPLSSVEVRAALRRAVIVGRGLYLGLDRVHGVARVVVTDYGGDAAMLRGTALVEVWGGDAGDVLARVEAEAPAGVAVVVVHRRARWHHRVGAWLRWLLWLVLEDPR